MTDTERMWPGRWPPVPTLLYQSHNWAVWGRLSCGLGTNTLGYLFIYDNPNQAQILKDILQNSSFLGALGESPPHGQALVYLKKAHLWISHPIFRQNKHKFGCVKGILSSVQSFTFSNSCQDVCTIGKSLQSWYCIWVDHAYICIKNQGPTAHHHDFVFNHPNRLSSQTTSPPTALFWLGFFNVPLDHQMELSFSSDETKWMIS